MRSAAVAEKRCPKMFEEVHSHLPVNAEHVPTVPEKAPRILLSIFTPSPRCGYLGEPPHGTTSGAPSVAISTRPGGGCHSRGEVWAAVGHVRAAANHELSPHVLRKSNTIKEWIHAGTCDGRPERRAE
jgi:hypothetical protein